MNAPLEIAQPFAPWAEEALVGAMLAEPIETAMQIGHALRADHFYDPFCRLIWETSLAILDDQQIPDCFTLLARLDGVVNLDKNQIQERLLGIFHINPGRTNLESWSKLIVDKAMERGLARVGERLMALAHAQNKSAEEKLEEASRLLAETHSNVSPNAIDEPNAADIVAQALKVIEEVQAGITRGLTTGIRALDKQTGGLKAGELYILAARPSVGKTTVATKMVSANLLQSKRVLMFSLEMGSDKIMTRMFAAEGRIHMNQLFNGVKLSTEDRVRLNAAAEKFAGSALTIDPSCNRSVRAIGRAARRMMARSGLDLIVVDYLGLLEADPGGNGKQTRNEEVAKMSRALKLLAMELQIPIVALSQLNRNSEHRVDKRPTLSDLRDSGAVEQDADAVFFLHRENIGVVSEGSLDATTDVAEIIIGKLRNGARNTVYVEFDGAHNDIRETDHRPAPPTKKGGDNPFFQ